MPGHTLLLDTNILLHALIAPERLPEPTRTLLAAGQGSCGLGGYPGPHWQPEKGALTREAAQSFLVDGRHEKHRKAEAVDERAARPGQRLCHGHGAHQDNR